MEQVSQTLMKYFIDQNFRHFQEIIQQKDK